MATYRVHLVLFDLRSKQPTHRRVIASSLVAVLALAVVACSGSDDTSADSATSGSTATTIEVVAPPAALAGSCPTQQELDAAQDRLEAASGNATTVDEMTAEYDASFAFLAAYLPQERQADLETVRSAFRDYLQVLDGIDLTDPNDLSDEQMSQLNEAGNTFDTPDVESANQRIEEYFGQACPDVDFTEGETTTTVGG